MYYHYDTHAVIYVFAVKKDQKLKAQRGIGFEDVIEAIKSERLLAVIEHPNPEKYPNQKVYLVDIRQYVYVVPFIEEGDKVFLKTIYPSASLLNSR